MSVGLYTSNRFLRQSSFGMTELIYRKKLAGVQRKKLVLPKAKEIRDADMDSQMTFWNGTLQIMAKNIQSWLRRYSLKL